MKQGQNATKNIIPKTKKEHSEFDEKVDGYQVPLCTFPDRHPGRGNQEENQEQNQIIKFHFLFHCGSIYKLFLSFTFYQVHMALINVHNFSPNVKNVKKNVKIFFYICRTKHIRINP